MLDTTFIEVLLFFFLFCIIFIYSLIDIKQRRIKNSWFIIIFLISLIKLIMDSKTIFTNFLFFMIFYAYVFFTILILFSFNFIGGADIKLMIGIIFIYNPIQTRGISSISDGYQFIIFFLFSFVVYHLKNILKNYFIIVKVKTSGLQGFSFSEKLALVSSRELKKIKNVHRFDRIIIRLNKKKNCYLFLAQDFSLRCWIVKFRALIPAMGFSLILALYF